MSVSRLWSWCAHLQSQSLWCDHHHPVLRLKKQLLAYLWVWRFFDYFSELYVCVCVCLFLDKNIAFMFHLGKRKDKWYKNGWTLIKLTLITDRLSWVDIRRLNSACWRWNDRFKVSHTCVWARLSLGATGQKGRDTRKMLNHQSALKSKPTSSSRRLYYRNVRENICDTAKNRSCHTRRADEDGVGNDSDLCEPVRTEWDALMWVWHVPIFHGTLFSSDDGPPVSCRPNWILQIIL